MQCQPFRFPPVPPPKPRPQATHRPLTTDDVLYGCDDFMPPARALNSSWPRVAVAPQLPTIYEERRLRCPRRELDDPDPDSKLRYSAIYCPPVWGLWHDTECFLAQAEQLEHFKVLARYRDIFINVSATMDAPRLAAERRYALPLFRKAFANGQLH